MINNPDPKKYRVKKLRKKGYVLVDRQIDRWRKSGSSKVIRLEALLKEQLNKEEKVKFNIMDLFKDDTE